MASAGDYVYAAKEAGLLVAYLKRDVSAQSFTDSTEAAVSWQTAVIDRQGGWNSGVNPTRYTPTIAGWYVVRGSVNYVGNATGSRRARWNFNGTADVFQQYGNLPTFTFQAQAPAVPFLFNGSTDYIELVGYQSSGGALSTTTGSSSSFFWLSYHGAA
jgi:hypothetical protein